MTYINVTAYKYATKCCTVTLLVTTINCGTPKGASQLPKISDMPKIQLMSDMQNIDVLQAINDNMLWRACINTFE